MTQLTTETNPEPERRRRIEAADFANFDSYMDALEVDSGPTPKDFATDAENSIVRQFRKGATREQVRAHLDQSEMLKEINVKFPESTLIRLERQVRKEVRDEKKGAEGQRDGNGNTGEHPPSQA